MASHHHDLQALMDASLKKSSSFTRTIMSKTLTAEEAVDLINSEKDGVFATTRGDGTPHVAWNPVAYVEDKLYTYADPRSVFYRNVSKNRNVAIAITSSNSAIFVEGVVMEVGQVNKMVDTLLARIFSKVENWIPKESPTYSSLTECKASIFEIKIQKILSYKSKLT